jgi:hypothetical protein
MTTITLLFFPTLFDVPLLCTTSVLQFILLPQMKKEIKRLDLIKLKPLGHSEMQNV